MSEREGKTLKDITDLITDGKHGDCENEVDSGYFFLSVKDIKENRLNYSQARQITKIDFEDTDRRTNLQPGDILFTNTGTIGRMAIAPDHELTRRTTFQKSVAILKPKREVVEPRYLFYLLKAENRRLSAYADGTTQKNLLLRDFRSFEVGSLPPLSEQNQITSVLGTLDDKIDLNRKTNETLEGIAKALFKSWFVDFDPVRAKAEGRATGLTNEMTDLFPDSFEESELGDIPSGWSIKKIGDVVARLPVGQKFDKKTVSQKGMVPVLDQSSDGIIGFHDQAPGVLASESDPLFTFANHTCAMRFMMESFSVIQNVFPLKGKDISTDWLYQAMLGKQVITEYKGHYPDLVDREIVVPSRGLDLVFGDVFRSFARSQLANKKQSLTLERLRDALLPRLISGELSVPDAEKMLDEVGI